MTDKRIATGLLALALLVSAAVPPKAEAERSVRQAHCDLLQHQLDGASKVNVSSQDAKTIERLQKRASALCNRKKEAQGLRAYAKALAIMGLKPIDAPSQATRQKP